MARSGGFEPPTAWFVARYSIQLSYERAKQTVQLQHQVGIALGYPAHRPSDHHYVMPKIVPDDFVEPRGFSYHRFITII